MISHASGALGEGKLSGSPDHAGLHTNSLSDGIHIDMNHLKKGEVK